MSRDARPFTVVKPSEFAGTVTVPLDTVNPFDAVINPELVIVFDVNNPEFVIDPDDKAPVFVIVFDDKLPVLLIVLD